MNFKKLVALGLAVVLAVPFTGCSAKSDDDTSADSTETSSEGSSDSGDLSKLKGTTINVYTHMGNRVLGEEVKDKDGNTYRDKDTAILAQLGERFTKETGIKVKFTVVSDENDLKPLFQVQDDGVDVFTCPNWSIKEWASYAEPYFTVDEGVQEYGDYAYAMPNDGKNIYCLMPARAYNQAVVYNEDVIKAAGYDEIPETLDDFNAMCQKIKDNGQTPIVLHRVENWPLSTINDFAGYVNGDPNTFTEMLKSDAPFSEDQPFGQTMKMYTDWKAKGFFEQEVYTDFGAAMDAVAYGKSGMMLFGSWVVPQIQGRVPKGQDASKIKFAPAPDFGKGRFVLSAPADNYAICKFSKHKEAAKAFIEYIAQDAQYIADSGFIANKKGVDPIVPDLYKIIDDMVTAKKCTALVSPATDDNTQANQDVLTEAGLWADNKYAGLLFDALDATKPDDWSAYDKQVKAENKAYAQYKKELGVSWKDN